MKNIFLDLYIFLEIKQLKLIYYKNLIINKIIFIL